ncbi:hypothetical protein RJP56_11125 [Shewanella baltica]|uniref:hypothetical protein n=1 Tax=Shewanella TaxID=22 RepID=UPI002871D8E6|nr:hypothetical protein [Shewanella baltica]MDR9766607.1 hypothetical protein [Shewanella baltica]
MGLPVTIYRSTDAGAPQLVTGKPSSWINILKKVLVEGYGDKLPLGWTVEFEDTGTRSIVFRNSLADGGSGCYVKFYSVGGSDNNYTALGIKVAQSFSDINTFVKGLGARGMENPTGTNDWEIIGTSRGFYISSLTSSDSMGITGSSGPKHQCYFVGDIQSNTANDSAPYTIVSGSSTNGDDNAAEGLNYFNNNLYADFNNTDGSSGRTFYNFLKSSFYQASNSPNGNAEQLGINHVMSPVMIYGATSQNTSITAPYMRGTVPGLYMSTFAGYRTESWPHEITQDDVKWVLLKSYHSPQMWVNTGNWYD